MPIDYNYNYPQVAREAGFKLRQYKDGPLDWRLMGSYEIERILRDQSLEQIDNVLLYLSEAPLGPILETNILDSGISKHFILSQFCIQYLLFCRNFLDETVAELRESHADAQLEIAKLKKALGEANNEILQLHKKMTQLEAIHEVLYPCHLCTKSFVSNEALNIHIGHKHAAALGGESQRKAETASHSKERNYDLSLINTIKLELEIKKLKERLNIAEREIKERASNNQEEKKEEKRATEEKKEEKRAMDMKNVGIQNNLMEAKEKDDCAELENAELIEQKEQITELQAKIAHMETWREKQKANNSESITEINQKLADMAKVLEFLKTKRETVEEAAPATMKPAASLENLEQVLTEKITEMGAANAKKLEQVVHDIELSYKDKLLRLETEMKRNDAARAAKSLAPVSRVRRGIPVRRPVNLSPSKRKLNETYVVEAFGGKAKADQPAVEEFRENESRAKDSRTDDSSGESNRTFVKSVEDVVPATAAAPPLQQDSTDVSLTLSDDETSVETPTEPNEAPKASEALREDAEVKKLKAEKLESAKIKPRNSVRQPKLYTRKDSKQIANKRLIGLGCNMKAKSLPKTSYKKICEELAEERSKLKKKYPNFYATRNKIKKFVNKLCSAKLPDNAASMLKTTLPLQPMVAPKQAYKLSALLQDKEEATEPVAEEKLESFDREPTVTSTPIKMSSQIDESFKQRLERVLASPIHHPAGQKTTAAQVHTQPKLGKSRPVPLPRKKVMFNTFTASEESVDSEAALNKNRETHGSSKLL